jgi:dihydroflavonol-4-reductase
MRAFLTGATGFIGGHVLRELTAGGATVRCLVRDPGRLADASGVEVVRGDLRDPGSLAGRLDGCDVLFHCAADYRLYARRPADLYESNVEGTRHILAEAARAGVRRVVYTSSVGALGLERDGAPADERTPASLADMVGHYKRSKYLAERVAEEWCDRGLPVVIVNPSTPVGEGDARPTATGRMIVDFANGRVPAYVDTGLNLVDVRDVAVGHLLAAEKGVPREKYILGGRNMSLREIYGVLGGLCGRPAPRLRLPHAVPLAVAAVDTGLARLLGREPRIALESVRLARHTMYFSAARAVRELGLPQSPVEEALRRAIEWYRANGYLGAG